MTITFKSDCPRCKGSKKLKSKATYTGFGWYVAKAKCYKCGSVFPGFTAK